jgi:Holliday junction resolvase
MSKQWEHQVANGIDEATDEETRAFRIGFSGSSAKPNGDVLITTPRECYALEVKRSKKDRFYIDAEDIDQLVECENSYTSVWLVMKFNNREPVSVRYYGNVTGWTTSTEVSDPSADDESATDDSEWQSLSATERIARLFPDCFDAHVTPDGNLRVDKPDTDVWSSARGGIADELAILRDLGIRNENSIVV